MEPTDRPNPESTPETDTELHDRLTRAARRVDVAPAPVARDDVGRIARRRTTRTRILAAVAAVVALGLGGAVLANTVVDDGPPTGIAEEPITEPTLEQETSSTDDPDEATTATDAPTTDAEIDATGVPITDTGAPPPTDSVPMAETPTAAVGVAPAEMVDGEPAVHGNLAVDQSGTVEWVVPWHDGFLASVRPSQQLPESLPPEINEMFSQEVRDFFNGELPGTLAEATEMLQEGDLYDEVADVVTNNPEVYDAIFGAPVPDAEARFSTDGASWQQVEFALPNGFVPNTQSSIQVASTGERLALLVMPEAVADLGQPELYSEIPVLLASTTDLLTWDVVEVDQAVPPVEIPDTFTYHVWGSSLAVSDDRWVVTTQASLDPRFEAFVEDDGAVREMESTSSGISVTLEDGTRTTSTWQELGASPEFVALMEENGGFYATSNVHTGSWGGASTSTPTEGGWGGGAVATDEGFYIATSRGVEYSPDGMSWTAIPLPGGGFADLLFEVDGTVAALTMSQDSTGDMTPVLSLLDATDQSWSLVEVAVPPRTSGSGPRSLADGVVVLQQWIDDPMVEGSSSDVPTTFVLASADGERWLLDELPAPADDGWYEALVARNGSTIVVHDGLEWLTYDLS